MIMEFEYKGVTYEAEVYDFQVNGICLKGSKEYLPYSYDLFEAANDLARNDLVAMAEALYDEEID